MRSTQATDLWTRPITWPLTNLTFGLFSYDPTKTTFQVSIVIWACIVTQACVVMCPKHSSLSVQRSRCQPIFFSYLFIVCVRTKLHFMFHQMLDMQDRELVGLILLTALSEEDLQLYQYHTRQQAVWYIYSITPLK